MKINSMTSKVTINLRKKINLYIDYILFLSLDLKVLNSYKFMGDTKFMI